MKAAILSVTEQGRQLSRNIAGSLHEHAVSRFCFQKHSDPEASDFASIYEQTAAVFSKSDALIFICACGIAVRAVAPHLRSKASDPAVLVLDDGGKFVIPLLSGHLGGANALAELLAGRLGAIPVVTTATDTGGKFSPDSFAAANSLLLTDLKAAKEIASAVLDGESIGIRSDHPYQNLPPELTEDTGCRTGIYIGTDVIKPFPVTLQLVPKNLVVGIGCRRGISAKAITDFTASVFAGAGLSEERICKAISIDLKADEPGLLAFCADRKIPLQTFSAAELTEAKGEFSASAFVVQTTGVDNVCERSAVLGSGGRLILKKTAGNGITVAVAEMPVLLDFAKRRTL